jgi:hypothetical protein
MRRTVTVILAAQEAERARIAPYRRRGGFSGSAEGRTEFAAD